jgi:hypothetical protein
VRSEAIFAPRPGPDDWRAAWPWPRRAIVAPILSDCITEPDSQPPQGSRWSYRVDAASNRKCWYLSKEAAIPAPQAGSPTAQLSKSAARDAISSAATVDDCLAAPNSRPPQGSHWYYRTDTANNRKCWYLSKEAVIPASQATSPMVAQPSKSATSNPLPLSEAEREVLFQQFLQWRKSQQGTP